MSITSSPMARHSEENLRAAIHAIQWYAWEALQRPGCLERARNPRPVWELVCRPTPTTEDNEPRLL